jgi:cytochrome c-type biogenesis protein CcmH/NrfG
MMMDIAVKAPLVKEGFWEWFDAVARPRLCERAETFAKMFEYLDAFNRPVFIIETGCLRTLDNWEGDGQSTVLFDKYVQDNGGDVHSVDIDPKATGLCRSLVSKCTQVHTGDSVSFLQKMARRESLPHLDLLYLDSFDLDPARPLASQIHHYRELEAALPMISPRTLVVVDDSPARIAADGMIEPTGKGGLVARYAEEIGATSKFVRWQVGWTGMDAKVLPLHTYTQGRMDDELKVLISRARQHYMNKQDLEAGNLYRLVLALTPDVADNGSGVMRIAHGEACVFFARLSFTNGMVGTALDWFQKALRADPRAVEYRLEMATKIFRPLKFWEAGRMEAHISTLMEPKNAAAWDILGGFEHDIGNVKNTLICYEKAREIEPDNLDYILSCITIYMDKMDSNRVRELSARLEGTEKWAEAKHCLGLLAYREGRFEEAIVLYDEALKGNVLNRPSVHWNKSLSLHALGRLKEGWREHAWRKEDKLQSALSTPIKRFNLPLWHGEAPPASIHVHTEAGAGDNICVSRYLLLLVERGYDVRYEAYPDMVPLFKRNFPGVKVHAQALDYPGTTGVEPFDYHVPIGELPHVFGTEVDTVPWPGVYIKADAELVEKCRRELLERRLKIGLCWFSGIRHGIWISEYGNRKSMHFDTLTPLFGTNNHCFVSLQIGPERAQNNEAIFDVLPEQPTWDDTAALIENLDLVITVDTAVAHLAGAMGKPTWLMMHTEGSWHWMAPRPGASWNERSPWYPSVKIYRATKAHEWGDVVSRIARDLHELGE